MPTPFIIIYHQHFQHQNTPAPVGRTAWWIHLSHRLFRPKCDENLNVVSTSPVCRAAGQTYLGKIAAMTVWSRQDSYRMYMYVDLMPCEFVGMVHWPTSQFNVIGAADRVSRHSPASRVPADCSWCCTSRSVKGCTLIAYVPNKTPTNNYFDSDTKSVASSGFFWNWEDIL